MKTTTVSTVLPCTPETFWAAFVDESYLRTLYLEELEYRAFEVIEIRETSRKLRIVPRARLPGPVARLIGETFAYEDHGSLDRARNEWTWRMVQPANLDPSRKPRPDVVQVHGTVRVERVDDGHCRRTDNFSIEAKLFGLGGLIESTLEKELRSSLDKECAFLSRWVEPV